MLHSFRHFNRVGRHPVRRDGVGQDSCDPRPPPDTPAQDALRRGSAGRERMGPHRWKAGTAWGACTSFFQPKTWLSFLTTKDLSEPKYRPIVRELVFPSLRRSVYSVYGIPSVDVDFSRPTSSISQATCTWIFFVLILHNWNN